MTAATIAVLFLLFTIVPQNGALPAPATAELCGDCHREIFQGWKRSAHAAAMESRLFQDALKLAAEDSGATVRKTCLGCHAPVAGRVGDLALVRKVSWEGITCDYCHSIREVDMSGANPFARVEFSTVKSGPSKNSLSQVHGSQFSAVHISSLLCADCHDYRNPLGFQVLSTYSEWKDSAYAQREASCQTCHMYTVQGPVVDPRVRQNAAQGINFHEMPGSRSVEQLNKAIRTHLSAERQGDTVKITVKLTNAGAGHYVPTGSALRKLVLEVRADAYNGRRASAERVYSRSIADASGKPIDREHYAFLKGAKVLDDTRIAPLETRTEVFSFPMPGRTPIRVTATLYYYYSPLADTEHQSKTKFFSVGYLVP